MLTIKCLQVGFYGAPEFGQNQVPCRECLCPGTRASGHSYAETCYLDDQTMQPICHCDDGYAGDRYVKYIGAEMSDNAIAKVSV